MIDPSTQAEALRFFFVDKLSLRAIAEKLGIGRETVAAIVSRRSVQLDRSGEGKRCSILAPHYPQIDALLREDSARSAVNYMINRAFIFKRILILRNLSKQ